MGADIRRREGAIYSADGTHLFWRSWEAPAPAAAFAVVHGLGEHSGRYEAFGAAMAERGYSSFAVDLRGMGQSAGARGRINAWSEWLEDVAALVRLVEERSGAREVIPLGHSFGGVALLSAVLDRIVVPERFVLSNPALRVKMPVPAWKSTLGRLTASVLPRVALANGVDPALISRDSSVVDAYRSDPLVHDRISTRLFNEWSRACEAIRERASEIRPPFLLLVGEDDRVIDPEGSRDLDRRATGADHQLVEFPGRYHEPFNDLGANEVFDALALWTARPSGAS